MRHERHEATIDNHPASVSVEESQAPVREKPAAWRSLAERHDDPEFLKAVDKEFPSLASFWVSRESRRSFLNRMGASFALAGLSGCVKQPEEKIVPSVEIPEQVPGRALQFATVMPLPGGSLGLLVQSHDGRPTKVEGNKLHPTSLGATDAYAQAEILNLYDPDRSQVVRERGQISAWSGFIQAMTPRMEMHRQKQGAGLRILTGNLTSPTLLSQLDSLLAEMPQAVWHEWEPSVSAASREGIRLAFGEDVTPYWKLDQADVVFSLDCDLLNDRRSGVRVSRDYGARRQTAPGSERPMSRIYVAESSPTQFGSAADHRLPVSPSQQGAILTALAGALGVAAVAPVTLDEAHARWVEALAADLKSAGTRSLVVVGTHLPAELHALGHAINAKLEAIGTTVTFHPPVDRPEGRTPGTLAELVTALTAGSVETLVILGGNPVYDSPAALGFPKALRSAAFVVHHGLYVDETARLATWHVPSTHFLEAWSDARSEEGVASLAQPLIAPIYSGKSPHELLSLLLNRPAETGYDAVRNYWKATLGEVDFDRRWNQALHDGIVADTSVAATTTTLQARGDAAGTGLPSATAGEVEVVIRTDPTLLDGRYANNGWLQELPKPISKIVWGNAAWISPATATEWGVKDGDVVEFSHGDARLEIPVVRIPGQAKGVVTLQLGHGRTLVGRNADGVGVNVSPLRPADHPWLTTAKHRVTGRHTKLVQTQHHFLMEGRDLVRHGTLAEYHESPDDPHFMHSHHHHGGDPNATFYPDWKKDGPQWGMSVDLTTCTGCSACVIACQSENNIPVVGPEQVRNQREMHWLRIDTYFTGDEDDPLIHHQPVSCQHCEHAPCEPVCPVGATTHSDDGLNEMAYNRCIGTRYCSNNCPYKVRRFNFLDFRIDIKELPVLQLAQNPDVSVRERGVMEKCTYCVQRIRSVGIKAEIEGRDIADGELVTACQAACAAQAIRFGNIADPDSDVSKAKASPLSYGLLSDLNTRPRTTYLAAIRNPNPALVTEGEHA